MLSAWGSCRFDAVDASAERETGFISWRPRYDSRMSEHHFLRGARVYLSGPMDFVASRADEKKLGWRNRVGDFLRAQGAIVFDPWFKPGVRGAQQYGLEDVNTVDVREEWTFAQGQAGDEKALALRGEVLGNPAHRSAHGRHERFHDRLCADQYLQRRHGARDRPLAPAMEAGAFR